jgi:hypothetical protein
MGRTKVFGSTTSITSEMGDTSSLAAMRGMTFLPDAVEGASTAS